MSVRVRAAVGRAFISTVVGSAVCAGISSAVSSTVTRIGSAVGSAVTRIGSAVSAAVATRGAVSTTIATGSAVTLVRSAVAARIGSAVGSAISSAVRAAVTTGHGRDVLVFKCHMNLHCRWLSPQLCLLGRFSSPPRRGSR